MSQDQQLREALEMFVDGAEAVLTKLRQDLGLPTKKEAHPAFDLSKINWVETKGTTGMYQLAQETANDRNENFDALRAYLASKDGKATLEGMFVWLFKDKTAIGMKKARFERKEKQ